MEFTVNISGIDEKSPIIDRLLAGILIIRKYEPDADVAAAHDEIYCGEYNPDAMTDAERKLMADWGWIENEDSWMKFV